MLLLWYWLLTSLLLIVWYFWCFVRTFGHVMLLEYSFNCNLLWEEWSQGLPVPRSRKECNSQLSFCVTNFYLQNISVSILFWQIFSVPIAKFPLVASIWHNLRLFLVTDKDLLRRIYGIYLVTKVLLNINNIRILKHFNKKELLLYLTLILEPVTGSTCMLKID